MKITVNGRSRSLRPEQLDRPLVEYLREDLDLTGAKRGCGIGVCGTCTVLVNGRAVQACSTTLRDVVGRDVLTIEGLGGRDGGLHPLQQAFVECGALQCGFCTPGMIMAAHAFLLRCPHPTRDQIRRALARNLCRCTGYKQIVDAVERAAPSYR